jgi:formylglycine-generating enzyme
MQIKTAVVLLIAMLLNAEKLFAQQAETETLPLGITKEKPQSGQFVETEAGYMIPYTMKLPGTEIEFHMVPIPAGTVLMGSPEGEEGRNENEGPQTKVSVEPFWISKYELTWAEYKHFMSLHDFFVRFKEESIREIKEENKIDTISAPSKLYDPSFTYEAGDEPNQPAATMSQYAAKLYTKWLSRSSGIFYRLPSEAEWEHAARAGTTTAYFFGDDASELENYAWFEDNSDLERHVVGELKPNPWGLYDIYGNVSEWVLDEKSDDGFGFLKGKTDLNSVDAIKWPTKIFGRVSKGGTWEFTADQCRSASRLFDDDNWKQEDPNVPKSPWWYTTYPGTGVGMRIMRPLNAPSDRQQQERFWSDTEAMEEIAANRINANGRGAYGLVDKKLPDAIKELQSKKREGGR